MKNKKIKLLNISFLLIVFVALTVSCERELSDDAQVATFSKVGDVFTDNFVNMGSNFYFPFEGSKQDAFSVDNEVGYMSNASFRIDVPNATDPTGNYAGAILRVDGAPRDLSGFTALTFWVKGSSGVSADAFGFGQDFLEDKYQVTANNVNIGTNWSKVIIPIPDPSLLSAERGVFWYALGTQRTQGSGYVVWIDDIKFENLATVAQPRPAISNGNNVTAATFVGVNLSVTGLTQTFNLPSGLDQTSTVAPSYFQFTSSNPSVATVNATGAVNVISQGTAVITATLGGVEAAGSLTVNSQGDFVFPAAPTRPASNVISVFSDAYSNVPVDYYNGFWGGSTTGSADFAVNGDNILNYTNFNYVGIQTGSPVVDASAMTMFHMDLYIPGAVPPNFDFLITLKDWGPDGRDGGGDDTIQQIFVRRNQVPSANTWISVDAPITLPVKNRIGLIIMENINFSSLRNFYVDNIYYYR